MPKGFDIRKPSPDDGHEAIRVAVVEAIDNLQLASGDTAISLELVDMLFVLVEQALAAITDVSARLDVLEPAVFTAEP